MARSRLMFRAQKRVALVLGSFGLIVFIMRTINLAIAGPLFPVFFYFDNISIILIAILCFFTALRDYWIFRVAQCLIMLCVVCLMIFFSRDFNLNVIAMLAFALILSVQYGFLSPPYQILKISVVGALSILVPLSVIILLDLFTLISFFTFLAGICADFIVVWIIFFDEINHYRERMEALEAKLSANWAFVKFGRNVSGVVHNLKSKLNAVLGFNELIALKAEDVSLEYAGLQKKSCEEMLDMIESLLFMVKSSRNPDPEPVSLSEMVKGVLTVFQVDANLRARMKTIIRVKDASLVFAPPSQIVQVLENVIGNAFAAMDSKTLMELSFEIDKREDLIWLSIRDNGKGIASCSDCKNKNCMACGKFSIGKSGKNEGHGIGMIYVQETMAGLKGKLSIESAVDQYTIVSLGFPLSAD